MSEQSPEKHLLENGLRSLARIGETTLVMLFAGIRYAQDKPSAPQLLRETFEKLGATYIKLGQFIASSPSLFPRAYVEEFQSCLDQTTPISFAEIEAKLAEEFDRPLTEIFSHIDQKCLASASIAQVHAATLVTGEEVVIKVQKPGVETILYTDLNFVHFATKMLERAMPKLKFASLAAIVNEIKIRMVREVDFIEEAKNIEDFQEFLKATNNTQVVAPKVYHRASTRTVLTMERFYGVPMTDIDAMKKHTKEPSQALITAMNTWFSSLMLCKSFHADLHAGNLMLLTDGRVGFIDFGIVGQLKPEVWQSAINFMQALQTTDYALMAENMVKMGMTNTVVDLKVLQKDIENMFKTLLMTDPQKIISGDTGDLNTLMMDMVQVGERHGIRFPSDFALLMKQMLYFDRFMQVLTPHMDLFADARLQLVAEEPVSKLIH
ncbi:MAG: AarF/ABC1/UbiB kinase family protein [Gammaproteobacteria bacterium]|nr:AarF/ABC1/UbiB kinase family protein [Gammaproteobacteria bacterium]